MRLHLYSKPGSNQNRVFHLLNVGCIKATVLIFLKLSLNKIIVFDVTVEKGQII